MTGALSVV